MITQYKQTMNEYELSRRDFHKLFAVMFAWLIGAQIKAEDLDNTGFRLDRTRHNDSTGRLEKALSDHWAEENKACRAVNYGHGILQDLMIQSAKTEDPDFDPWVTPRERKIVAMVVQWMGTNCGRSFLFEASKQAGEEFVCWPFHNQNRKL